MEWQQLSNLTGGREVVVERVRLVGSEVAIEGEFEMPPLARLAGEDQVFVAAFVRSHGSIKRMEQLFGVSYPTVKNRLNRIAGQLEFVEIDADLPPGREDVLRQLEQGRISVDEAVDLLKR